MDNILRAFPRPSGGVDVWLSKVIDPMGRKLEKEALEEALSSIGHGGEGVPPEKPRVLIKRRRSPTIDDDVIVPKTRVVMKTTPVSSDEARPSSPKRPRVVLKLADGNRGVRASLKAQAHEEKPSGIKLSLKTRRPAQEQPETTAAPMVVAVRKEEKRKARLRHVTQELPPEPPEPKPSTIPVRATNAKRQPEATIPADPSPPPAKLKSSRKSKPTGTPAPVPPDPDPPKPPKVEKEPEQKEKKDKKKKKKKDDKKKTVRIQSTPEILDAPPVKKPRMEKKEKPAPTPAPTPTPTPTPTPNVAPGSRWDPVKRARLQNDGKETMDLIPTLMPITYAQSLWTYRSGFCLKLDPKQSTKGLPPAIISVVNRDSLDTAIGMRGSAGSHVAVLNLANAWRAGGGFINGAMAQEESMCYRSSLYLSLETGMKRRNGKNTYPWKGQVADPKHRPYGVTCLYSPNVVIVRSRWTGASTPGSHQLLSWVKEMKQGTRKQIPDDHRIGVLSIAGLEGPGVYKGPGGELFFADGNARDFTKEIIQLAVRQGIKRGHDKFVLGAVGCGVFQNPSDDVARCSLEVLQDPEFRGCIRAVKFAVMGDENDPRSNYNVFRRILEGQRTA